MILFFGISGKARPTFAIMVLTIVNGLLTSIALGYNFSRQLVSRWAFKAAIAMSLVAMIAMATGGATIKLAVHPSC